MSQSMKVYITRWSETSKLFFPLSLLKLQCAHFYIHKQFAEIISTLIFTLLNQFVTSQSYRILATLGAHDQTGSILT